MTDDRDDRREDDPGDPRRNTPPRDAEALDERLEELEARVRDLRAELGRPPDGPLGLPRPPTSREVLSFTGEYAIPTAIAVLEANVRALRALQQVIRLLDPERSVDEAERDRLESRAADASRATLDRLESVLTDVETTIRENDLPRESEARDILEDARRINREIRERVERERERTDDRTHANDRERAGRDDSGLEGATRIELTDEGETGGDDDAGDTDDAEDADDAATDGRGEVDVEAELQSIRDEIETREADAASARNQSGNDESESDEQVGAETGPEATDEAGETGTEANADEGDTGDGEASDAETDADEGDSSDADGGEREAGGDDEA